jgi:hypothetical protein
MKGEKINFDAAASAKPKPDTATRTNERSEIAFPYLDLDTAVTVAKHVNNRVGISSCPLDELAAEMGQTTAGGNFRLKTGAARLFGFVEKDGQSSLKLTDLGCRLVSPESETDAKVAAFLQVPLYNQIYEKYRGKLLPPTKALEREMQTLGVASTLTVKARHAFQRSARQAGYFNSGDDRLVKPRTTATAGSPAETLDQTAADALPQEQDATQSRRGGSGNGGGAGYHPFIQGLLQTLPEPGTLWTVEGRAAWLQAAAQNFTLIYKGEGKIDVQAVTTPHKHDKPA